MSNQVLVLLPLTWSFHLVKNTTKTILLFFINRIVVLFLFCFWFGIGIGIVFKTSNQLFGVIFKRINKRAKKLAYNKSKSSEARVICQLNCAFCNSSWLECLNGVGLLCNPTPSNSFKHAAASQQHCSCRCCFCETWAGCCIFFFFFFFKLT